MDISADPKTRVLEVGDWVITLILCAIPIVNLVMLFIWGFSETENLNRKHFARAYLIIMAVMIGIWVIFIMTVGTAIMGALGELG